jgi:hypothetical protein
MSSDINFYINWNKKFFSLTFENQVKKIENFETLEKIFFNSIYFYFITTPFLLWNKLDFLKHCWILG